MNQYIVAVIQEEVLDLHVCYDLDIRLTPIIPSGTYNRNFRVFGMAFCGSPWSR